MDQFHKSFFRIPQCSTQKRNGHISVLNGALWGVGKAHSEICELGQLVDDISRNVMPFWGNFGVFFFCILIVHVTKPLRNENIHVSLSSASKLTKQNVAGFKILCGFHMLAYQIN